MNSARQPTDLQPVAGFQIDQQGRFDGRVLVQPIETALLYILSQINAQSASDGGDFGQGRRVRLADHRIVAQYTGVLAD